MVSIGDLEGSAAAHVTERLGGAGDGSEGCRIQAGAANEGSVDVGGGEQVSRVVGLHGPSIEDARARRQRGATCRLSQPRMAAWTSWASAGPAFLPVPMAQTGS